MGSLALVSMLGRDRVGLVAAQEPNSSRYVSSRTMSPLQTSKLA
jgi:hypothetical protein